MSENPGPVSGEMSSRVWDFVPCWRLHPDDPPNSCTVRCSECFKHGFELPLEVVEETRERWQQRMSEERSETSR